MNVGTWVAVLTLALVGPAVPQQQMNPLQMMNTARLLGCRMVGKDKGIDAEFAKALLGMSNPGTTRRCMLGCMIAYMYYSTSFVYWETGHSIVPHFPGGLFGQMQDVGGECILESLVKQRKCNIVTAIGNCFIRKENYYFDEWLQDKYMPWLDCWDWAKTWIPPFAFIDEQISGVRDAFTQGLKGLIRRTANFKFPQSSILDKPPPPLPLSLPAPSKITEPTPPPKP